MTTGGGTCVTAKGLDISLAALQRQDPYINNIVDVASQVALYTFNNRANEWEKTDVEGTLFVYTRLASPRHGFTIMNRLSMDNLTEPITKDLDFQLQDPFLLYRNARLTIHGIWFYDKVDCQRIAELMNNLTRQEQHLHAQQQCGWVSPRGLDYGDGKGVDILQMLNKARDEYDKGKPSSEPKEIGGGAVIHDNPNLIKPIPVKPTDRQKLTLQDRRPKNEVVQDGDSKHVSLTALFGTISPQTGPPNPFVAGVPEVSASQSCSEHTAHTSTGGASPKTSPSQTCPAIQKLMCGQRGHLEPVSESPENQLCENGVPLKPRFCTSHGDPIQRLFQAIPHHTHPPHPSSTSSGPCCPPQAEQVGFSGIHHHQQRLPQLQPHPEVQPQPLIIGSEIMLPPQLPPVTGVVSPHELLQRLQLVQQEQGQNQQTPRHNLAPCFPEPTFPQHPLPGRPVESWIDGASNVQTPHKGSSQFQGIQATASPTVLMSPSVFVQARTTKASRDACPTSAPLLPSQIPEEPRVLSKSQLQATLIHLIRNDTQFLERIYEVYVSQFSKGPSKKHL
ncbi:mRNA-decapping enzyme 1B [Denticeps clupeoides]|uniref:5'-(N(7)-methylguanosine 5'-triphospho)-[mRNA] hydrolase n=1 Tax=Denticeps clupeoides TaxID=299321 RepID=A0AAY4DBW6_9TELE|nr:mRNA-decapping enzyme 1B [Denticeps clupeoides]